RHEPSESREASWSACAAAPLLQSPPISKRQSTGRTPRRFARFLGKLVQGPNAPPILEVGPPQERSSERGQFVRAIKASQRADDPSALQGRRSSGFQCAHPFESRRFSSTKLQSLIRSLPCAKWGLALGRNRTASTRSSSWFRRCSLFRYL